MQGRGSSVPVVDHEVTYLLEALQEYPKRTVTMWHSPASDLGVAIDNAQGIWSLVDHLVAKGHTKLGFIGSRRSGQLRERRDAFLERTRYHRVEGLGADRFRKLA